jgi:hypothetical protein
MMCISNKILLKLKIILTLLLILGIHGTAMAADEWLKVVIPDAAHSLFFNLTQQRMWISDHIEEHDGYPFTKLKKNKGQLIITVEHQYVSKLSQSRKKVTQKLVLKVFVTNEPSSPNEPLSSNEPSGSNEPSSPNAPIIKGTLSTKGILTFQTNLGKELRTFRIPVQVQLLKQSP